MQTAARGTADRARLNRLVVAAGATSVAVAVVLTLLIGSPVMLAAVVVVGRCFCCTTEILEDSRREQLIRELFMRSGAAAFSRSASSTADVLT